MGGQPTPDSARPPPNVSVYRANARLNGLPAIFGQAGGEPGVLQRLVSGRRRWSLVGRHVPDDYLLTVSSAEYYLLRLRQASRARRRAPALWKVLERPLGHIKQRNRPAIEDARSNKPFQHHRVLREKSATDGLERAAAGILSDAYLRIPNKLLLSYYSPAPLR